MIHILQKLLAVALCVSIVGTLDADTNYRGILTGSPYFFTRSQSRNKVLQDVGEVGHTDLYGINSWYGTFDVVLAYERSFRTSHVLDVLFSPVGTNTICPAPSCNSLSNNTLPCANPPCTECRTFKIQGSAVPNRDPNAWLAEYFYLPTDFYSTISFSPRISNTLLFLDYYQGLDPLICGAYFRIYGPVTITHWDLGFCENVISRGSMGYLTGYFTPSPLTGSFVGVPANMLLDNFSSYAIGEVPQGLVNNGVNAQPLHYAKIHRGVQNKTGFADLRFECGLDLPQSACHYVGFNIQGAAPTGNRPDAFYCFQPVVGNGKHWELGVGVTAGYNFWMNEAETSVLSFSIDANITHLFGTHQQRTFDIRNKPISRYMLAERLGTPVVNLFANTSGGGLAGGVAPNLQFQGEFAPIANLTTTNVKVSIDAQADVVAWFNFIWCDWSFDVGYNFWGTTFERISLDKCGVDCKNPLALCNITQANTWALKGDAQVYGFDIIDGIEVGLSATESNASLTTGTNMLIGVPVNNNAANNAGIDNAQFAQAAANGNVLFSSTSATLQTQTSLNPVTLACTDIDFTRNQGLTHKFFAHASYTWEYECWIPYLGIGGSGEFAQRNHKDCRPPIVTTECKKNTDTRGSHMRSATSLWSVWVKGGVSF